LCFPNFKIRGLANVTELAWTELYHSRDADEPIDLSLNNVIAGHPQLTRDWWECQRHGAGDNVFGALTSEIAKLQKKIKIDHAPATLEDRRG